MADTVFIFGAGASRKTGAPLVREFIDAAHDLMRQAPPTLNQADFALVFDVIQDRLKDLYAKSVVDLNNIESVFNLVEMARIIRKLPRTEPDQIERVAHAMRSVLAQTIEHRCVFAFDGEQLTPSVEYSRIADLCGRAAKQSPAHRYALITFNYDVALDYALHFGGVQFDYCLQETQPRGVPLLKLHGSLNWAGCPKCGAVRPLLMDRYFQGRQLRRGSQGRQLLHMSAALGLLGNHCEDANGAGDPAIVPPSWNKTQYREHFTNVWHRAALELGEASEIVVVGYSFPESDVFFRDLLALGLAGTGRLTRFAVVDEDGNVAGRFQNLLGPAARSRFFPVSAKFEDWVEGHLRTQAAVRT